MARKLAYPLVHVGNFFSGLHGHLLIPSGFVSSVKCLCMDLLADFGVDQVRAFKPVCSISNLMA